MSTFTAIDFETATAKRSSICQVGLVLVHNCRIVDRIKYLVRPPENLYNEANISIHGITPDKTENEETFDKVYLKISQHIIGKSIVAHNASFDIDCLTKALKYYNKPVPNAQWYCTRKIYNEKLSVACDMFGIKYTPHDALSDAEACAMLMIRDINRM
jgi:DNA polymerase-3 subunit epsilon